ncbi:major facilitator superfamily domain-containing protein [Boletus edulis BED1]|uniref:Major facilitator superfamily domain-containing protein n=1 Tax=Boletus edulis BED1 TaxID=1328754 RepID=A0AAD4BU64_BOLED|nr:major facilitator superfamily domain-containing protein [Boletus edulis BED1]
MPVARAHSPCVNEPKNPTTVLSPPKLADQTNLLPFRKVVAVFAGLALCIVVCALDSVIIATALPTISAYFNAGSVASWVPSAYLLTSTTFQPLYGRFSDIFGRKVMVCFALSVFMVGSLAAGFSRNFIELIVWRGITGVGGGGTLSLAQIIISDVVSLRERGKYQGIIGGVLAIGYAIGPPMGGALSEKVTWRWCFWVHLPVSLIAICVVLFVLPLKPVEGDVKKQVKLALTPQRKLLVIDYLGAVLSLSGSALVILPLIWGGVTFPWNSPVVLTPLCSGILVILLFCFWEWKGARLPIVPMYIFKHVTVTGVYIAMFVNGFVFFSSLYYLPQFFEVALGQSPIQSGVSLMPVLVCQTVSSWLAGITVSRTGRYRTIVYVGFGIWAVGCGCLSTVTKSTPKALLVFYMALAGIGAGQTMQTTTVAAQASVSRQDMAVVTAVRNFVRQMGGTLSLAIGSILINNTLRSALVSLGLSSSAIKTIVDNPAILGAHTSPARLASLGLGPAQATYALAHGYTQGFKFVFVLNACLASVATLTSIFMIKHKELDRGDEERLREEANRLLEGGKGKESRPGMEKGERDLEMWKLK